MLWIFLLLGSQLGRGDSDYIPGPHNTYWVTCEGFQEPKTVQGPTFVAPRSGTAAFVRVTAGPNEDSCSNTSELFVKKPSGAAFIPIFVQKPAEFLRGNGMKLIDWSADGRFLLIDLIQWQHASDAPVNRSLLVFDSMNQAVITVDVSRIFAGEPKDCLTEVRGVAFRGHSKIVVKASSQPYYEAGEEKPLNPGCPTYSRIWELSLDSPSVKKLSSFKARRNASIQQGRN